MKIKELKKEVQKLFSEKDYRITDEYDKITFTLSTKKYDLVICEDDIHIFFHKNPNKILELIKCLKEMEG